MLKNSQRQTLLLTLDKDKAFDQALWPYIFDHRVKASASIIHLLTGLKLCIKTKKASVRVNGTISEAFNLRKGTRQGDPLSQRVHNNREILRG